MTFFFAPQLERVAVRRIPSLRVAATRSAVQDATAVGAKFRCPHCGAVSCWCQSTVKPSDDRRPLSGPHARAAGCPTQQFSRTARFGIPGVNPRRARAAVMRAAEVIANRQLNVELTAMARRDGGRDRSTALAERAARSAASAEKGAAVRTAPELNPPAWGVRTAFLSP
jgi:hypothetical protein